MAKDDKKPAENEGRSSPKFGNRISVNYEEEDESINSSMEKILEINEDQSLSTMYIRMSGVEDRKYMKKSLKKELPAADAGPFKYRPNWWFISFLIVMLSVQSIHSGYAMGTYNRIGNMLEARYHWTIEQRNLYEGLISSLLVLGITFGRLYGAKFV